MFWILFWFLFPSWRLNVWYLQKDFNHRRNFYVENADNLILNTRVNLYKRFVPLTTCRNIIENYTGVVWKEIKEVTKNSKYNSEKECNWIWWNQVFKRRYQWKKRMETSCFIPDLVHRKNCNICLHILTYVFHMFENLWKHMFWPEMKTYMFEHMKNICFPCM